MSKVTEDMLPELPEKVVTDTHLPTGVRIWGYTATQMHDYARAALDAQPSPGGQRDDSPMAKMAAALRGKAEAERAAFDQRVQSGEWGPMPDNPDVLELPPLPEEVDSVRCMIRGEKAFAEPCDYYFTSKQMRDYARTALAATGKQSGRDIGAFELWAKSAGLDTKIYDHNGMYSHPVTRGARLGWQAATASRETGEK